MYEALGEDDAQEVLKNCTPKKGRALLKTKSKTPTKVTPKKNLAKKSLNFEEVESLLENKIVLDKATVKEWFKNLLGVDAHHRERMFILQVAEKHGWAFAKSKKDISLSFLSM